MADRFVFVSSPHHGSIPAPGDYDGDGRSDASVFAQPTNGAPRIVEFLNGPHVGSNPHIPGATGGPFFAHDPSLRGGAFVAAGDHDGNGRRDVVAHPAHVNVYIPLVKP